mmetsp:Transcript_38353/g.99084  ORF Transcript_38353/g.99084 Transcript_38353/m.99084 type:complete len:215 (+) Transcript_38353:61-705(+)
MASGSAHNDVHPLVCVHEVTQLSHLQREGRIVEGLPELPRLHPTQVSDQLARLEAALALGDFLAPLREDLAGGRLTLLQHGAQEPLRLAAGALHLLVPDLVDSALALAVLQQDMPQPHLRGVLLTCPLLRRLLGVLDAFEEDNDGAEAEVPHLPQELHRRVHHCARGHASPTSAPPEDRGDSHGLADRFVERAANESESMVLGLQTQDLHVRRR